MSYFSRMLISASALIVAVSTANAGEKTMVDFNYNKMAPIEKTYAEFNATARKACKSELRGSVRYSMRQKKKYLTDCKVYLMSEIIAATKNNELIVFHAQLTHSNGLIKTWKTKIKPSVHD